MSTLFYHCRKHGIRSTYYLHVLLHASQTIRFAATAHFSQICKTIAVQCRWSRKSKALNNENFLIAIFFCIKKKFQNARNSGAREQLQFPVGRFWCVAGVDLLCVFALTFLHWVFDGSKYNDK